ncbi:hypothetical protein A3K72_04330 [Candidatus Woesearchaeota archaeon RBG_13_36_6]|nr:MAG: hypothetical protein A3K72_04330 [Candidatus Woesearchaeota archaeon RBG_13_36_6]
MLSIMLVYKICPISFNLKPTNLIIYKVKSEFIADCGVYSQSIYNIRVEKLIHMKWGKTASAESRKRAFHRESKATHRKQESGAKNFI